MSPATGALALWLLVALPAGVGGALCLLGRRGERVAAPLSLATAAVGVALAGIVAAVRPSVAAPFVAAPSVAAPSVAAPSVAGASFGLAVDALSALVVPAVAVVTLLVLVSSTATIGSSRARFHGLMLLFAAAVMTTATASTLPALLLGWEVMGAMSYALIGFRWRDGERVSAGATAFLTTRTADLGLYAAAAAGLAGGGGLALAALPDARGSWLHVAAAGVLVAALGKAAQLPFAFWLSRAMVGPSPVSALLHSAAMVAMGGYLLLRTAPLLAASGWAAPVAAWTGALTALLLGAVALAQRDLKQLLAASTSAQLGFVVLAAGLSAVAGGAAHLVAHAATKALLFLVAGAWLAALGTKQLPALRGAGRCWPTVGVCAGIGALALAGVAPLSLWATKDAVLAAALQRSPALYAVGLAAAALSAAYAGKVLFMTWGRAPEAIECSFDTEQRGTRRVDAAQRLALVALAAGAALLGVLALPPVGAVLRGALGEAPGPAPGTVELAGSAGLALLVLAAVARWPLTRLPLPRPRWAVSWLGLEAAARALAVRPVLGLAAALARFDDRVLDRGVTALARGGLAAARLAARADTDGVDAGVETLARGGLAAGRLAARAETSGLDAGVERLARGVRRLAGLARRPQTGQLHEYYLQAVVLLGLAIVLLVAVS